ncbi:hypothetical protein CRYUN_Cryun24cG0036200 [Craigia yunnanensis]
MERSTPVQKPHTSTADLLTWTEAPSSASSNSTASSASAQRSSGRYNQPCDGISKVVFGGQVTDDEAQSLLKKKPCSGYKMKEMTGSDIFAANGASEPTASNPTNKTGLLVYQQAVNGISQISFSADGSVSPKKPTSLSEVAKQRELGGTLQTESEAKNKKQISNAKYKEINGHDIFAPSEIKPRSLTAACSTESRESKDIGEPAPRNVRTSVKVSNGNVPPGSAEKPLSRAKLREMSGNNIFSDGKVESRDYLGGVRKPPGGESSIALV